MDGGLQIFDKFGANFVMNSRGRREEQRRGPERGKGEEQSAGG